MIGALGDRCDTSKDVNDTNSVTGRSTQRSQKVKKEAVAETTLAFHAAQTKHRVPCTVFVGQLPYQATAKDVETHFAKTCGMPSRVRLLTKRAQDGGGSRGMAFVEFLSEAAVHSALRLHHSSMCGRRINVERTIGGGGTMPNRADKLKSLRDKQGAQMLCTARELVARKLPENSAAAAEAYGEEEASGWLTAADVDDRVLHFLSTVQPVVAEAALDDCASLDCNGVRNRPAYLMGLLRRKVAESDTTIETDRDSRKRKLCNQGSRNADDQISKSKAGSAMMTKVLEDEGGKIDKKVKIKSGKKLSSNVQADVDRRPRKRKASAVAALGKQLAKSTNISSSPLVLRKKLKKEEKSANCTKGPKKSKNAK